MKLALATLLLLITLVSLAVAQVRPQRVRAVESVMAERLVVKVAPNYPPMARKALIQGKVVLKLEINKSGDVERLQLISGHPMLARAAIDAVKQWKYKPFLLNGDPIAVETRTSVNFTLSNNPPAEGVVGDMPGGIPRGEQGWIISNVPVEAARFGVVRVSHGVMAGLLVSKVAPEYPVDAKKQHVEGTVVMTVNVDKEGKVSNIKLISGHPLLAPAALDAVKLWKYRPYLLNGAPVEVETEVEVNFTLAS